MRTGESDLWPSCRACRSAREAQIGDCVTKLRIAYSGLICVCVCMYVCIVCLRSVAIVATIGQRKGEQTNYNRFFICNSARKHRIAQTAHRLTTTMQLSSTTAHFCRETARSFTATQY